MSEDARRFMGQDLYNDPMADELEMKEKFYVPNFNRILGNKDLSFQYDLYGEFEKLPKALNKSIYFYDINLEWNQENTSIMSNNFKLINIIKEGWSLIKIILAIF